METLAWIGLSQSLFAALLIGTKREMGIADRILTGWLCLLGIEFLTCALDFNLFGHPLLSNSFLLFNPAFFLYIKSLTDRKFKLRWVLLLHLVPYFSFELSTYILEEPQSLESFIQKGPNLGFRIAFSIISVASWLIYNAKSYQLVRRHKIRLQDEFSSIEKSMSLRWILFVVIFYISFCVIAYGLGVYAISYRTNLLFPNIFVYSTLLLLVYILGYYGLMQKDIYSRISREEVDIKYRNSSLSKKVKEKIKLQLLSHFEKDKPYMNPELNMDMLAAHLGIPKYQITEVLNMEIGKNFFQFVNSYRIEAVKEKLQDPKNPYSIEAIGYECGFNSKSSFFTVFKTLTGQTPQQYKQNSTQLS